MASWLEASGLSGSNVDDYHVAFRALNAEGLLKVNPKPAQPRQSFSEADLETMPLEDLAALAGAEERQPGRTCVATTAIRNFGEVIRRPRR